MSGVVRVAVDIGGTFTDATLIDEDTGAVSIAKVLTTPADPSEGFMRAVDRALANGDVTAAQVGFVVHATTVATNAIIEGKIARGGFVTTEGFRDLLEIARQVRPSLYDTQFEKAKPLVPRDRAVTVAERLGPAGEVLLPLEDDSVRAAAGILRREGVETVAVCLLHAYVNPEHEQRVGAILAEELPGVPVSLSAEVAPEFREYLRASTTVINAVIRPVVERYLERIESRLADAGVRAKLLVMQSSGGVFSAEAARTRPVYMVESGPAAGVIASAHLGETLGRPDILSFDMGGTTAKVGLIQGGQPSVTKDYNVGGNAGAGIGGMSLSGYPVRTPVVDLVEIGAGGGSIAWVDSGGLLRVGPQSAGADPGPVCYGRGGVEPTVTDANVVLGRLNPELLPRRRDRPRRRECAARDRGALRQAARARRHRGGERDRRDRERRDGQRAPPDLRPARLRPARLRALRLRRRRPCARERARARRRDPGPAHPPQPRHLLRHRPALDRSDARRRRDRDAAPRRPGRGRGGVDVRPARGGRPGGARGGGPRARGDELRPEDRPPLRGPELRAHRPRGADASLLERFHAEHERTYGFSAPEEPVEAVSLRLTSVGTIEKPPPRPLEAGGKAEPKEHRPVYFAESAGYVDCPIYDRYALPAGATFAGPAVVEELDSTTVLHPGYVLLVDERRQPADRERSGVTDSEWRSRRT